MYNEDGTPVQVYSNEEGGSYALSSQGEVIAAPVPSTPTAVPYSYELHGGQPSSMGFMPGRGLVYTGGGEYDGAGFTWGVEPGFDPYAYRKDPNVPPMLSDFYNAWNQTHMNRYGVPYNRPWGKHGETALRDQFVSQYTDAINEYNQLYGTNYLPNPQAIEAFNSAPTSYAAFDPTSRQGSSGFISGMLEDVGPILAIGASIFGMPYLAPILGTVGAGAVLGGAGAALTGGDGGDILKGALMGGLGSAAQGIGAGIGAELVGATVSASTASAIGNAVVGGAKTLIQGGDLTDAFANAVTSGAASVAGGYAGDIVGSMVGDSLGSPAATNVLTNAAKAAASAAVRGGDIGQAALTAGLGTGVNAAYNELQKIDLGASTPPDVTVTPVSSDAADGTQFSVDPLVSTIPFEEFPINDYFPVQEPAPVPTEPTPSAEPTPPVVDYVPVEEPPVQEPTPPVVDYAPVEEPAPLPVEPPVEEPAPLPVEPPVEEPPVQEPTPPVELPVEAPPVEAPPVVDSVPVEEPAPLPQDPLSTDPVVDEYPVHDWYAADQDDAQMGTVLEPAPTEGPGWVSGEALPTGNYNLPPEAPTSVKIPATGAPAPRPAAPPAPRPTTVPQTASQQQSAFDMLMRLASATPASAPQVNVQGPALAMIPGWESVSTPYGGPSLFASGGSVPDMYAINQELLKILRG